MNTQEFAFRVLIELAVMLHKMVLHGAFGSELQQRFRRGCDD